MKKPRSRSLRGFCPPVVASRVVRIRSTGCDAMAPGSHGPVVGANDDPLAEIRSRGS